MLITFNMYASIEYFTNKKGGKHAIKRPAASRPGVGNDKPEQKDMTL
jgi:hypothetical protein